MRQNSNKVLDELLILRIKESDSKSLSLFVKRWHTKLIWYSHQTIHDDEEAKDIVQDSWQTILHGIQNLQNPGSYKSWMYRVIRNKSIDRLREINRKNQVQEQIMLESIPQVEQDDNRESELQIIAKLIQLLPFDLKEILQLFYLETQSVEEIGSILSIPTGTVKSRLFRARELLKKELMKAKKHIES